MFDGLADVDEGAVDELVTVDDVVGRDGLERKDGKRDGVLLSPQSACCRPRPRRPRRPRPVRDCMVLEEEEINQFIDSVSDFTQATMRQSG